MKNENTKVTKGIKRALVGITSVVMLMTNAAVFSASADTTGAAAETAVSSQIDLSVGEKYHEHAIIPGNYTRDGHTFDFKYSDGFFETDPLMYNTHMANTSMAMAHASVTVVDGTDYSHGADCITSVLEQEGFGDLSVSDTYLQKPDTDTVASVIARKKINTAEGEKTVVSITVRSAGYEKEWASNVTIGYDANNRNAEAQGFAKSADEVMKRVKEYLSDETRANEFKDGKIVFWLQGYSRGAAIANLTAKRIIDEYDGAPVYAYCHGCPQGGTESSELYDKDYTSIHNVINVDDVTTYVAPSKWGFKRYGVDHYLQDDNFDSESLRRNDLFENNLADNNCWAKPSDKKIQDVCDQIYKLTDGKTPNEHMDNVQHHSPLGIWDRKVIREWASAKVVHDDKHRETSERLSSLMDDIAYGVSREEYVASGMEGALRRFMIFANSGGGLEESLAKIKFDGLGDYIKDNNKFGIFKNLYLVNDDGQSLARNVWDTLINNKNRRFFIDFNENLRDNIANTAGYYITKNNDILKQFESYPGGSNQAVNDIKILIKNALKGIKDINNVVSIAKAGGELSRNHSFIQSLAWVRVADSWFEPTAKDCD